MTHLTPFALFALCLAPALARAEEAPMLPSEPIATFSIAAADPASGEVGVAVASRFFAVGNVVPWAEAGVGAVATQAFANTTFGPRGLERMRAGGAPLDVLKQLLAADDQAAKRQVGMVAADGRSATHTGTACTTWAGGRNGPGYAVQGNILTGEAVVAAMEKAFLETRGTLARRLYAALTAGDAAGGDARGRQSAALLVARAGGGYGGFTDRYVDVRVDDHAAPMTELGRLLDIAEVNGLWNLAWTAYTKKLHAEALPIMEQTTELARRAQSPVLPEVLYDLAIIRAHGGKAEAGLAALAESIELNPGLRDGARTDEDLAPLRSLPGFGPLLADP